MKSSTSRRLYRTARPILMYRQPSPVLRSRSIVRTEQRRTRAYSCPVKSSSRFSMLAPSGCAAVRRLVTERDTRVRYDLDNRENLPRSGAGFLGSGFLEHFLDEFAAGRFGRRLR